jgi:ribosomal protein L14E/L6E/L27E
MEKIEVGSAVCPVNGRFAGKLMAVVSIRDGYADVCDGKRRRLGKPKRKKLCHLRLLSPDSPLLSVDAGLTDGMIRRHLGALRTGAGFPDI